MLNNTLRILLLLLATTLLSKFSITALNPYLATQLFSSEGAYSLWWGLRLDMTASTALATPIILLLLVIHLGGGRPSLVKPLLFIAGLWLILTTTADAIYMLEAGRHVTFEVFTSSGLEQGLIATALTTYITQTLTGLGLTLLLAVATWKLPLGTSTSQISQPNAARKVRWPAATGLLLMWLAVTATAVRGGWSDAPQSPMNAYKIGDPNQAALAWNAPYAITYYLTKGQKSAAQQQTPPPSSQDMTLLAEYLRGHHQQALELPTKQANVLIVLLESWPAADLASYVQSISGAASPSAAPYFDSLRQQSLTTNALYADGYRTVEGMFASFCSFPNPIGGGVAGTQLQGADYYCLPRLLKEQGFDTHFIQGSGKGIVGAFAQSLGFTHSYGKSDYGFAGTENYWGYMDDDIYRFTLDKLASLTGPYLVTVNTGTTHDTYLPSEDDYIFGKENRAALRRNVIHSADGALQRFLTRLPKVLTEPTLVVLMADHTAAVEPNDLERNAIPFLMFATDGSVPTQTRPISAGQLDIAPTIIDWLGGQVPWFTGQSLLAEQYNGFAHYSDGQTVHWIEGKHSVQFNATAIDLEHSSTACFEIANNGLALTPDSCANEDYGNMLRRAQAYTRYTQSLLFAGKTRDFAELFSETTEQ